MTAVGGTTCLLANVLIGKFWNKEYVTRDDLIGVVMVVGGAVCIAVGTAKGAQPEITDFKDLVEKFENTHFARHDSAVDVCRLKAPRCTAMDWIFIPAHCFALP